LVINNNLGFISRFSHNTSVTHRRTDERTTTHTKGPFLPLTIGPKAKRIMIAD